MSDEIQKIVDESLSSINLKELIKDLEPTKEEQEILARAIADYASLKAKEQLGQDVEQEIKIVEATISNLSFMNESKARKLLLPFSSVVEGGVIFLILAGLVDLAFKVVFEKINEIDPEN